MGTESEQVLADHLRDWLLNECEHALRMDLSADRLCCAPCLRDRLLASGWLAAQRREAAREAWDEGYRSAAWKSYQRTGIAIDAPERAEPTNPYRAEIAGAGE